MTAPSATARRALWLLARFGVLVVAGLGFGRCRWSVAGLDRRLVGDAVEIRTESLTAIAHGVSLLGRSWVLIPPAALVGLVFRRRLGSRSWGRCSRSSAPMGCSETPATGPESRDAQR